MLLAGLLDAGTGGVALTLEASEGLAVLLAEQNATWALSLTKRAVILDLGRISMTGEAAACSTTPPVAQAYPRRVSRA